MTQDKERCKEERLFEADTRREGGRLVRKYTLSRSGLKAADITFQARSVERSLILDKVSCKVLVFSQPLGIQ